MVLEKEVMTVLLLPLLSCVERLYSDLAAAVVVVVVVVVDVVINSRRYSLKFSSSVCPLKFWDFRPPRAGRTA